MNITTEQSQAISSIKTGMLSSPQIAFLLSYKLLVIDYDLKCLESATYNMRISGIVITKDAKSKTNKRITLCDEDDINRNKRKCIRLEPNSLTYVTTYETFFLPSSIIARFNLKSKWVHRGLLLGTGPIIDPEFNGKILIPIHNFSETVVELSNLDEIISVEFTKTIDNDQVLYRKDNTVAKYIKNPSSEYSLEKFIDRVGGQLPGSSVLAKIGKLESSQKELVQKHNLLFSINLLATIVAAIALYALINNTMSVVSDANKYVSDAAMVIKKNEHDDYDFRNFAAKGELDKINSRLLKAEIVLSHFHDWSNVNGTNESVSEHYFSIKGLDDRLNKIESSISKLSEDHHEKDTTN